MNLEHFPPLRLRTLNQVPLRPQGDFVLYWMTSFRRCTSNFALQRAVSLATQLKRPLLVFEPLRCDYPWASLRLHRFVIDGMTDNAATLERRGVGYYPYLERRPGEGKGLLAALAERACAVVGDDSPGFFIPRMLQAAARSLPARLEVVDANGLPPLRIADKDYPSAYSFRRLLQKHLAGHLGEGPSADPLHSYAGGEAAIPEAVSARWPASPRSELEHPDDLLRKIPIDHDVGPVLLRGGARAAQQQLQHFVSDALSRYATERNQPAAGVTSGLSPYLHFGHISSHEVFAAVAAREAWDRAFLSPDTRGRRHGWWGMSEAAEAFLDQLVTWRELGFNFCAFRDDAPRFDSLPQWARSTLENHADDPRPHRYAREQLDAALTHDPLWNAAQRQLLREGTIHGYLRMLWGKNILAWSTSPQEALATMIELNNRYALDGRDPNSYSGILWCLGRYDRPWPERAVYGKVRSMSSANTARKLDVTPYLETYAP